MPQDKNSQDGARLNVYGCEFSLSDDGSTALDQLLNDFQFFSCPAVQNPIVLEIFDADPPYHSVPDGVATTYTPRNVSFTRDGCTYIDYSGRALATWDRTQRVFRIYSRDPHLQYEAAYLFLLSRIGEELDQRHMHRIHAMAMSTQGKAVLAILPMGGGKSTLCSGLLKFPEFQMLSDDSPFISGDGRIYAFPLRLGLLPGSETAIPPEYQRTIKRMEFGPKVLVSYEYFAKRVTASAGPGIVFIGKRSLAETCVIRPAGAWDQFKCIMVNCVVGLGLYQGLEFVLTRSPVQLLAKAGIAWSRLRIARTLFAHSQVYHLTLGRNQELNAVTVRSFVTENLGIKDSSPPRSDK